jgi:hypothetical protein
VPQARTWAAWEGLLQQPWEGLPADPRGAASATVKYSTYSSWFAVPPPEGEAEDIVGGRGAKCIPRYVQCTAGVPGKWLIPLVRLRTGGHHLAIETGRWSGTPRNERVCEMCDQGVEEDELHFLFECPAYAPVRTRFAQSLFAELGGIQATITAVTQEGQFWRFMEQEPRHVARFVFECMQLSDEEMNGSDSTGSEISLLSDYRLPITN